MDAIRGMQAIFTSGRVWWMPLDGALHGLAIDRMMQWNLVILTALFIFSHLLLIFSIFRPLRRTRPSPPTEQPHSIWKSELMPLLAISLIYVWMALTAHHLWADIGFQGAAPQALQVEVTGMQFQWYFRYPGPDGQFGRTRPELINAPAGNPLGLDRTDSHSADDIVSSVLILPAGSEVDLNLRSFDVIHGFFIPGMRLKQDAIPGMAMHIHFTPALPGDYPILCSQVCGLGHARMQSHLQIVSAGNFQQWMKYHRQPTDYKHATNIDGGRS